MQFEARITQKTILNDIYFELWFEYNSKEKVKPGQFFQIKVPGEGFHLRKPISVYDVRENQVALLIKRIGYGTERLFDLMPEELIDIIGPLGNGFDLPAKKSCLLVSGGIGYAPLKYLKQTLETNNIVVWLHGGRTVNDVFPADMIYTDDGSSGTQGYVTHGLEKLIANNKYDQIYICGPKVMMENCTKLLNGYDAQIQVSLEEYMACGIGVCYGCVVPIKNEENFVYKTVCKDGPIFSAGEVIWHEQA